jgi:hypothetical protein
MSEFLSGNKNILINPTNKYIELQPYTTELTPASIKPMIKTILSEIKDDSYAVYLGCDHNFEGLSETNIGLLKAGGRLFCNYTGKFSRLQPTN